MTTNKELAAALMLLDRIEAEAEAERLASASCFIAVTIDHETNDHSYHGPFADPAEATRWANELNAGIHPDSPLEVTVVAVSPPC